MKSHLLITTFTLLGTTCSKKDNRKCAWQITQNGTRIRINSDERKLEELTASTLK